MKLLIRYSEDVDFLTLWNGRLSDGGEDVSAGLTAFFDDSDDSVVSFTIQCAVKELAPILFDEKSCARGIIRKKVGQEGYLEDSPLLIEYSQDSDTLRLSNGREISRWQAVADSLTAELDRDGEVVGLTLQRATAQLRPFLQRGQPPREFARSA